MTIQTKGKFENCSYALNHNPIIELKGFLVIPLNPIINKNYQNVKNSANPL